MQQQQQLKIGDKVRLNDRSKYRVGATGTVKFVTGSEVWITCDEDGEVSPPLHKWFCDPI